jgi:hypothetical protein
MSLQIGFLELVLNHPKYQGLTSVRSQETEAFTSAKPFPMRLNLLIDHILYQLTVPEEILVYVYIMIEDLLEAGFVCQFNIHRIILSGLFLSCKFVLDCRILNSTLESMIGLRKGELSKMEAALMAFLNWRIKFKHFKRVHEKMVRAAEKREESTEDSENESLSSEDVTLEEADQNDFSELSAFLCVSE